MSNNYEKYNRFHLWDFVREQKEKGLIRHYGFSFHDSPALCQNEVIPTVVNIESNRLTKLSWFLKA